MFCFDCAKHGRYFSSLLMGVSFELVWSGGMSKKSKGGREEKSQGVVGDVSDLEAHQNFMDIKVL